MTEITHALLTACKLPKPRGERHLFITLADVQTFYDTFSGWDTHELTLRMNTDRTYAVDVCCLENPPEPSAVSGPCEM